MKVISYISTQKGIAGLGNILIKIRLNSKISHNEIMFEPGDGVDHLMPDGTTLPDENGAYWCASSSAAEKMPIWSTKRAGKTGGVRFKRIKIDPSKWIIRDTRRDPIKAANTFIVCQGQKYDWRLIFNFIAWFLLIVLKDKENRKVCSEICSEALGYNEAWRIDPPTLDNIVANENVT